MLLENLSVLLVIWKRKCNQLSGFEEDGWKFVKFLGCSCEDDVDVMYVLCIYISNRSFKYSGMCVPITFSAKHR